MGAWKSCNVCRNFYPRSPCGERQIPLHCFLTIKIFLSTLSLRRATAPPYNLMIYHAFLSTLSLRRATMQEIAQQRKQRISIHALLAESDAHATSRAGQGSYFYPRSPCGERQTESDTEERSQGISIHALLAESDYITQKKNQPGKSFLSTLSLRRATFSLGAKADSPTFLSTLSLRRATVGVLPCYLDNIDFYPRSPCGERRLYFKSLKGI